MSQRTPGSSQRTTRSSSGTKPITYVLLGLAMLALFATGFGISRFLSTRGSSADVTPAASCTTVSVTPGATLPKPKSITVNVYNSTKTAGLAKRSAAELKTRGFVIGTVDNDPQGQVVKGVAEIRHGPDAARQAQMLALYIPGAEVVPTQTKGTSVDLAVGPEFGSILTTKQVTASLSSPSPSVSGPGCVTPVAEASPSA